ncbi:hypothetical protein GCM10029976_052750 [Kribbella albertanoniae]
MPRAAPQGVGPDLHHPVSGSDDAWRAMVKRGRGDGVGVGRWWRSAGRMGLPAAGAMAGQAVCPRGVRSDLHHPVSGPGGAWQAMVKRGRGDGVGVGRWWRSAERAGSPAAGKGGVAVRGEEVGWADVGAITSGVGTRWQAWRWWGGAIVMAWGSAGVGRRRPAGVGPDLHHPVSGPGRARRARDRRGSVVVSRLDGGGGPLGE